MIIIREEQLRALKLYIAGVKVNEIANRVGYSPATVYNWVKNSPKPVWQMARGENGVPVVLRYGTEIKFKRPKPKVGKVDFRVIFSTS